MGARLVEANFASLEEKVNSGVVSFVGSDGPESIVVSGGPVSTMIDRLAGEASVLAAGSVARTSNVWGPSASAAVV